MAEIKKILGTSAEQFSIGLKGKKTTLAVDGQNLSIDKKLAINEINEKTSGSGVTIETVLIKDGLVDGVDVSAIGALSHTQNTDTGTTAGSFVIDSDGETPVQVKNNAGVVELRNSADSDYVDLKVKNLEVIGTQTIIDSVDLSITDNIIMINKDETGEGVTLGSAGIEVERGSLTNAKLIFDESADKWKAGLAGSEIALSLEGHTHVSSDVTDFNEAAQDAVGGMLTDSTSIDFTYDDENATITAIVKDDSITKEKIGADVAGSGLGQNADGSLEVNVDSSTIEINNDILRIKDGGVSAAKLNADVAGDGLVLNGASNAIDVKVGDGIQISSDAVAVKLDGTTLTVGANGLKVTDNTFQPLDSDLTAIAGLESTGIIARTAEGVAAVRTITGTENLITVENGNGVDGNPTITIGSKVVTDDSTHTLTNKTFDANGTGNSISNIEVADFATGVLDTDLTSVSENDDTLASAKAIKTYVDNVTVGTIRRLAMPVGLTTVSSTYSIPANAIISDVKVNVKTGYSVDSTLEVKINGSSPLVIMASVDNDAESKGIYANYEEIEVASANTGVVQVVVGGSPVAGEAVVYVDFYANTLA